MRDLKEYLTEVEAMQFVKRQEKTVKPHGKKAVVTPTPTPAPDAAPIEYHSAEDSANFWEAVRNGRKGAIDMSHLTPEEFVEELSKIR